MHHSSKKPLRRYGCDSLSRLGEGQGEGDEEAGFLRQPREIC